MDVDKANGDGTSAPVIKVLGIGGGGSNVVQHLLNQGMSGAQFCVINTDEQALKRSTAPVKLQIGVECCGGLGAGCDFVHGRKAAEESRAELKQELVGADLVILIACLGGGTGGGASPVIAQIARELGIATVAIVTLPFAFEGKKHRLHAEVDLDLLCAQVDALVMVDNNESLALLDDNASIINAFNVSNELLNRAVHFAINSWSAKHKLYFASAQAVEAIGTRFYVLIHCARTQGENAVADAVTQVMHAPWREALYVAPNSCLHVYSMLEFSVKEQDKFVENTVRKALGPDIACQFHKAFVSSVILKEGQAQLALLAQLGDIESAQETLEK